MKIKSFEKFFRVKKWVAPSITVGNIKKAKLCVQCNWCANHLGNQLLSYWYPIKPFWNWICCSSILPLVQFVSESVQNFLNQYKIFWTGIKCFNLGQFDFCCCCFCFCVKTKKVFLAPWIFSSSSLLSSSPLYLSSPAIPSLLSQHPSPYSFYSMLTLWALNHRPLVFLWIHVLIPCQWAMETWMQVPLFFNYIYTVLLIHFLTLFKSDMYAGPWALLSPKSKHDRLCWFHLVKSTLVSTDLNYI